MKIRKQILVLVISTIALFAYAQGRGMINRMEREKVIAVLSGLKSDMSETETIKFLLDRGLNWDWASIGGQPTNEVQIWYRFGTTNIEELCITFRAKQDMTFAEWERQCRTNSSFFKAEILRSEKGGLVGIWSTNAPDQKIK